MNRQTIILVWFLFFLYSISYGQNASIKGKVIDRRINEEICFASVVLLNEKGGKVDSTASDFDGRYGFFQIENGTYKIRVSSSNLGDTISNEIQINSDNVLHLDLYLPKPCAEENNTGICPYCDSKDSVIKALGLDAIVDHFFIDKKSKKKHFRKIRKKGYETIGTGEEEWLHEIYIKRENKKFRNPCYKWFCKGCKRIF